MINYDIHGPKCYRHYLTKRGVKRDNSSGIITGSAKQLLKQQEKEFVTLAILFLTHAF
jgi:hypothetical protein